MSLNDGTDIKFSRESLYPEAHYPSVSEYAELISAQAEAHPDEPLDGAISDAKSAFYLITADEESSMLSTVDLCVSDPSGIPKEIDLVGVHLTNFFGGTISSDIFCISSYAVQWLHNKGNKAPRSVVYVDDGGIVDCRSKLTNSHEEYNNIGRLIWGQNGISMTKQARWEERLIVVGWDFDMRRSIMRVTPKLRTLCKIFILIFENIDLNAKKARFEDVEKLAGCLEWISKCTPIAKGFTSSFHASLAIRDRNYSKPGK
jgi:hypothetical protein